jgi:hypothetical protein
MASMMMNTAAGIAFEIDDDRHDLAQMRGWTLHKSGYICRELTEGGRRGKKLRFWLAHMAFGRKPEPGNVIDHVDGNPMNNKRCNLREVTKSQNAQNRAAITRRGTYRGVTWKSDQGASGKWCARAMVGGKSYHIGYFVDQEDAAEAIAAWRRKNMTHSSQDGVN